jgi:hypothetical protein
VGRRGQGVGCGDYVDLDWDLRRGRSKGRLVGWLLMLLLFVVVIVEKYLESGFCSSTVWESRWAELEL